MMIDGKVPVYLASASLEAARVRKWAAELERAKAFAVTSQWFVDAERWAGRDHHLTRDAQKVQAEECKNGIRRAHVLWLLWPAAPTYGAMFELGFAACHQWHVGHDFLRIIVTGTGCSSTIFTADADYRDEEDALGFHELSRIAGRLLKAEAVR